MPSIIFVGGDDVTAGYDSVQDCIVKYIKVGWGDDIDLKCNTLCSGDARNTVLDPEGTAFRQGNSTSEITKAITKNPGLPIILFSAGCAKTLTIANHLKSMNQPLSLLHVNEPYSCDSTVKSNINKAIELGLPVTNVYNGGYACVGIEIAGATKLTGRVNHFQSLTVLAKLIRGNLGSTPPQTAPSTAQSTAQNSEKKLTPEEEAQKKREAEEAERRSKIAKEPRLVSSKIILKKISGPGELVGVTELDLVQGEVSFEGLQFTEPGEYKISITGTSTQIEPTELSITVSPSEEIVEQDASGTELETKGTRPIIAQIDEPKIKIEPMTYLGSNSPNQQPDSDMETAFGLLPFVYYGLVQVSPADIQTLGIFYDEFVPKCYITFQDSFGLINNPETAPTSNSTIEIFLNSGSEQLKSIHLKFLIDQKKDNKNGTITIFGKLDLKEFYKIGYSSYTGTSFQTLREISKQLGLGFNSNIIETNDSMKWLRNGLNYESFIRSIISKSYISDESFMVGYIDYYYSFNFVDVEKEYNRNNETDLAITSSGVSALSDTTDAQKTTRLVLSNDKSLSDTPYFFSKYKFVNNSTVQLTTTGVTTDTKAYDRTKKNFLKFNVDSLSSSDPKLKILRSDDDIKTNFNTDYTGKIDTDNVHENYLYAITQNKRNLINLCNVMADLILPIPNFNIYKFQKISVVFTNQKETVVEPETVITRYTGEWIILDIGFTYKKSALLQTVRIARKELTKTQQEINTETTKKDETQNNEINENQEPTTQTVPNSIYQVGQEVYIEQDGRMFVFIVEKVLDNGIEISGRIKKSAYGIPYDYRIVTPSPRTEGLTGSSASQTTGLTGSFTNDALLDEVSPNDLFLQVGDISNYYTYEEIDNLRRQNVDIRTSPISILYTEIVESGVEKIRADATFLINDTTRSSGFGIASIVPDNIELSKQSAAKAAEINAINIYKQSSGTSGPNITPTQEFNNDNPFQF